ncbi:hypothetical protein IKE96_00075, partial [bacterium]|nr:hypothetical protein [bacterium]
MRNAINFYYNLILEDIHQKGDIYYFDYNNVRYVLVQYGNNPEILNDIYNLQMAILNNGLYIHQIILNKDGQIATIINGSPYILMKTIYYNDNITYSMIISFINAFVYRYENIIKDFGSLNNSRDFLLERVNWGDLWARKNDYLEYQISQVGQKNLILRNSFSYYIGLGETAIELVNSISFNDIVKGIAHRRIDSSFNTFDLYNPLNLVIDSRIRDVAEYFKTSFFNGKDINDELNYFLKYSNLNQTEYLLFLARMLYPTYYFDLFEDIIIGKNDKEEIKKIT